MIKYFYANLVSNQNPNILTTKLQINFYDSEHKSVFTTLQVSAL